MKKTIQEQLKNVKKQGECLIYQGFINNRGYGMFRSEGSVYLAHRASYEHYIGSIPQGKIVLHTCNNAKCVNPNHLYLGEYADKYQGEDKEKRALNRYLNQLSISISKGVFEFVVENKNFTRKNIKKIVLEILEQFFNSRDIKEIV